MCLKKRFYFNNEPFLYLELQNISRLDNKFSGGKDVMCPVFVLVWPVQVERGVPAEAGRSNSVGVETPALLV